MHHLTRYRQIIRDLIRTYAGYKPAVGDVQIEVVFDEPNDHYELIHSGCTWTFVTARSGFSTTAPKRDRGRSGEGRHPSRSHRSCLQATGDPASYRLRHGVTSSVRGAHRVSPCRVLPRGPEGFLYEPPFSIT
jgi:hypothetical protein